MKILMLADPASVHTLRWANSMVERGNEVYVLGLSSYDKSLYDRRVSIETLNLPLKMKARPDGSLVKIFYLLAVRRIRLLIRDYKPDILHSHYASSFGLLGALVNFHPYIISVWGADIYNFPEKSIIHKKVISFSLSRADKVLSTSRVMALRAQQYTDKEIEITPFGIDTEKFKPKKVNSVFEKGTIIGTIKTLERKYGIEYLIRAFCQVKKELPENELKLLIVGSGSMEKQLKELVTQLDLQHDVIFTGFINYNMIPDYHNMIDIFVAVSTEDSESFGVSVLEAGSCARPVIVSDTGGLSEVVEDGKTGLIVKKECIEELTSALRRLLTDPELRTVLGNNARQSVIEKYSWDMSVDKMISIYTSCLET